MHVQNCNNEGIQRGIFVTDDKTMGGEQYEWKEITATVSLYILLNSSWINNVLVY